MYLTDYENKFKHWEKYAELPFGLYFLADELQQEAYFSQRITFLKGFEATEFTRLIHKEIPKVFKSEIFLDISKCWNHDIEIAKVREWLFQCKIPFNQEIYMLYDEQVIRTQWKVFVKYWDIFSWSVGISLEIIDHTRSWRLEVHHEDIMTFSSMK